VGAGTGQATLPLCPHFNKVIGLEPSAGQLSSVTSVASNLEFRQSQAEKIDLPSGSVDLVISAQAAHWFQLENFFGEAHRLLRDNGVLAIWGYGTLSVDDEQANKEIQDFYWNIIGSQYWPANRKMIDREYKDINPEIVFKNQERKAFAMSQEMNLDFFEGYLTTWSGITKYKEINKLDPIVPLRKKLENTPLGLRSTFKVTWPIFMILARKFRC